MTSPAEWVTVELDRTPLPKRRPSEVEVMRRAADLWLTGERPPVPQEETTPLYQVVELELSLAETGVLYRREELGRLLWPGGEVVDEPAAVKPRKWSRQWWVENLSWRRQVAGGLSGLVLLVSAWGWWVQ